MNKYLRLINIDYPSQTNKQTITNQRPSTTEISSSSSKHSFARAHKNQLLSINPKSIDLYKLHIASNHTNTNTGSASCFLFTLFIYIASLTGVQPLANLVPIEKSISKLRYNLDTANKPSSPVHRKIVIPHRWRVTVQNKPALNIGAELLICQSSTSKHKHSGTVFDKRNS